MSESPQPVVRSPAPGVRLGVLLFAMLFPTLATWVYFVALAGRPSMGVAYATGKAIQFGFPLVWVFAVERRRLRIAKAQMQGLVRGVLSGLLIGVILLFAYASDAFGIRTYLMIEADAPGAIREKLGEFGADTLAGFLAIAAGYAVVHSLLEEYYWRWFVFAELRRFVPAAGAIGLSSVAFMAHHVIVVGMYVNWAPAVTVFFSACVAVGGAAWAWLYQRSGSLAAPWISHLLVDAALMAIGYDLAWGLG